MNHVLLFTAGLLLLLGTACTDDAAPDQAPQAAAPMAAASASDTSCYELRTYYTHDGKLDALLTRFRDHTTALFERHGFTNVGYWVPTEQDNTLTYVVSFPTCAARDAAWDAFRADADWQAAYAASRADGPLVERVVSVLMDATDYTPAIGPAAANPPRTFELRTYTTHPGRLDALNARFRDHTMALFTKHGMANIGYWMPRNADQGAGNTLIYLIAHASREAASASWAAFVADPDWVAARDASEADGKIVAGVTSVFMTSTDFSAIQ